MHLPIEKNMTIQLNPAETKSYPGPLLDALIRRLDLRDDAALASRLELAPRMIKMVREGRLLVSQSMLVQMHAVSGLSVGALEDMLHGAAGSAGSAPLPTPVDPRPR